MKLETQKKITYQLVFGLDKVDCLDNDIIKGSVVPNRNVSIHRLHTIGSREVRLRLSKHILMSFINKYDILNHHQFGFRKNYSPYMAAIDLNDNIAGIWSGK